jgi:hypothetical protein
MRQDGLGFIKYKGIAGDCQKESDVLTGDMADSTGILHHDIRNYILVCSPRMTLSETWFFWTTVILLLA